jgi:hypothetical protein
MPLSVIWKNGGLQFTGERHYKRRVEAIYNRSIHQSRFLGAFL